MLFGTLALLAGCSGGTFTVGSQTPPPPSSPGIVLSSTSFNFGVVATGAPSAAQTLTITNSGTGALNVTAATFTGDFAAIGNSCGTSVAAGGSCTISLVFTPAATGARSGSLTLASNVSGSSPTVTLTGTGGTPQATLSGNSLAFGSVTVASTSGAQLIVLSNGGTAPLTIASLNVSGDFMRSTTTCSAMLPVGAQCQIALVFTPAAVGPRAGSLSIASNAGAAAQVVTLGGTGVAPVTAAGNSFIVNVRAGNLPIAQASVQLYAAGTGGNGSASTALLATPMLTSVNGMVTILAGFTCPAATSSLYLVSSGGTVGSGSANANIKLMAALGTCSTLASGAVYSVNEATTVAAGYALAQFYSGAGSIGASGTNITGLTNAFVTAASLVDPLSGTSPGATLPSTASSPAARMNSVANMLNACVLSNSACTSLYSATSAGLSIPGNTLDAMFNLARNPANKVSALYQQSLLSSAYAPALTASPSDWTMFVNYTGGGMNSPSGIGVDSTGAVWVSSYFYAASKFSPQGVPVFPNGLYGVGLNNSYGLAIDLNDDVWIPNEQPYTNYGVGSVTVLTPTGGFTSGGGGFQLGGLNYPLSVAIDPNGTAWVVDYGNSHVTLLNSLGTPLSGTDGYTTPLFAFPVAVAVDANHFGWIANQSGKTVTRVAPDGSSFVNYNCCVGASGIAIDQGNNVWVANFYGDSVSLISSNGNVVGNASYTAANGISRPQGIAIDGAGNVWVANYRQTYLSEIAGVNGVTVGASLSPQTGFAADAGLLEAYALSIDASGNLWVSNQGSNSITKVIGLASPVKTPLSVLPKAP